MLLFPSIDTPIKLEGNQSDVIFPVFVICFSFPRHILLIPSEKRKGENRIYKWHLALLAFTYVLLFILTRNIVRFKGLTTQNFDVRTKKSFS